MSEQDWFGRFFGQEGLGLRAYHRFERVVGALLSLAVSVVILFALFQLGQGLLGALGAGLGEFDYRVFQRLFEMILTVLIALEFNHTLAEWVKGRHSLVQARTVVLIGILVVVRKFILVDMEQTAPAFIAALAAAILALGAVYWLVIDIHHRHGESDEGVSRRGGNRHG